MLLYTCLLLQLRNIDASVFGCFECLQPVADHMVNLSVYLRWPTSRCWACACRGLLTPDTAVYMMTAMNQQQQQQQPDLADTAAVLNTQQKLSQLSLADSNPSSQAQQQQQQQQDAAAGTLQAPPVQSRVAAAAGGVQLLNAVSRGAAPPATNVVHVYTNDGEWFPVKKKLLRPCIALTKVGMMGMVPITRNDAGFDAAMVQVLTQLHTCAYLCAMQGELPVLFKNSCCTLQPLADVTGWQTQHPSLRVGA